MDLETAFVEGFAAVKEYVDGAICDLTKRLEALAAAPLPVSVVGALIDRSGHLVLSHSDGSTRDMGLVVGKDANPVELDGAIATSIADLQKRVEAIAALPAPVAACGAVIDRDGHLVLSFSDGSTKDVGPVVGKDGEPGKPGHDAVGFDDLSLEHDGERLMTLRFAKGDVVKEFPLTIPAVIDRGVYKAGEPYLKGDGVSFGGSFFIAQADTNEKPETGDGWRLAIKRGRDGKDGVVRELPAPQPVRVR